MNNSARLPSCLDVERHFLATIINKPILIAEYESLLDRELFFNDTHALIFSCVKKCYNEYKTEFDQVIVTQTIKSLGITIKDDIEIEDYIATMCKNSVVSNKVLKNYFKDLYKYHLIRQHIKNLNEAEKRIRAIEKGTLSDVVSRIDSNLAKCATSYIEDEDEPVDIYDGMQEHLEELALQAQEEANYIIENPFPTANRWWGEFSAGDLIVFLAGPKVGKSTTLSNIADKVIKNNPKVKVLYLDTELETARVRRRIVSSKSGVNEAKIRTGKWAFEEGVREKIEALYEVFQKRRGKFYHLYVANKPISELIPIIKRFKAKHLKKGEKLLIINDYLKITGEKIDQTNQEWRALGTKTSQFKDLASELDCPILTAVQANEDQSIAAAKRISWTASNILLLKRKTLEEINEHGQEFGTHTLSDLYLRNQGEDWEHEEFVRDESDTGEVEYKKNFLNLEYKNFNIEESGTFAEIITRAVSPMDLTEPRTREVKDDDIPF